MTTELNAELVLDAHAVLGEGPVWDAEASVLWWVDIDGRRIHRFDPATGADETIETASPVGAVAPRDGGGLVVALADGVWTLDPPDRWRSLAPFVGEPDLRCNDAKCDPAGRFIVGTMADDERPIGGLYAVEPDGRVRQLLDGLSVSNGLAWSADGSTMFFIDSPTRRVDAFDYRVATGELAGRRVHVAFDGDGQAVPDGMAIDAEGCLWVAFWDGWSVRRIRPDGTLAAIVRVPAAQVTSCAFGGPDLGDLYITTAASDLDDAARAAQPHAGGLFRVRPGVAGVLPARFAS